MREHDPEVCGIDFHSDCDGCQAVAIREAKAALSPIDLAVQRYQKLQDDHWRQLGGVKYPAQHPESLTKEEMGRLCWTLLHPHNRPLFRELFRELFADEIMVMSLAVCQEVTHG